MRINVDFLKKTPKGEWVATFGDNQRISFNNTGDIYTSTFAGIHHNEPEFIYYMQYVKRVIEYDVVIRLRKSRDDEKPRVPKLRRKDPAEYAEPTYHHGKECRYCATKLTIINRTYKSTGQQCDTCIKLYNNWYTLPNRGKDPHFLDMLDTHGIEFVREYVKKQIVKGIHTNHLKNETTNVDKESGHKGQPNKVGKSCSICLNKMNTLAETGTRYTICRVCETGKIRLAHSKLPIKLWNEWVTTIGLDFAIEYVENLRRERSLRRKYGVQWSVSTSWITDIEVPPHVLKPVLALVSEKAVVKPIQHGTTSGYYRELRLVKAGELDKTCALCRTANQKAIRTRQKRNTKTLKHGTLLMYEKELFEGNVCNLCKAAYTGHNVRKTLEKK